MQNCNAKFKIKKFSKSFGFLALVLAFGLYLSGFIAASAVNMSSDSYKIQWGNINIGGSNPSSTSYKMGITMGQTGPGLYSSTGYKIRAGFQYIHSIIPFSFTISATSVALGSLTPSSPKTASLNLTVSAGGAGGYQVLAFENHPLRNNQNTDIPDTTCDSSDCNETTAGVWSLSTTYGFGFNMSGNDIPSDFVDSTYFRQFADQEAGESPQTIMSSNQVTKSSVATATFKANVSATQAAGDYENAITFVAVPKY
jgi:hypothetical protein